MLAKSREVYPLARRVLLTAYSDIDAAVRAINEAHLDYYLSKPWDPPEERLFPVVDDLLDAWQAEYLPEAKGLRLVGHQWSPRSHAIKDFLASNLIPLSLDRGRAGCGRAGAAGCRRSGRRRASGAVLRRRRPGAAQPGASAGGRATRPSRFRPPTMYTTSRSSAPVRPALRRRCTAHRKGCGRCCSTGMLRAGRRAPVPGSRTISGFRPASAAAN